VDDSEITQSLTYGLNELEWQSVLTLSYALASQNDVKSTDKLSVFDLLAKYRLENAERESGRERGGAGSEGGKIRGDGGGGEIEARAGGEGEREGEEKEKPSGNRPNYSLFDPTTLKIASKKLSPYSLKLFLLLERLKNVRKQTYIDGWKNIWIVKAPEVSRGLGLQLLYR
jgi:hypothetical protein